MRIRNLLAVGALLSVGLALPCAAQSGCEDCAATFALDSSFVDGGTIDGTLTLDTATDLFVGADLIASGFPHLSNFTITEIAQQGQSGGGEFVNIISADSLNAELQLALPATTLAGFDGSPVVSSALFIENTAVHGSGSLEPMGGNTSVTPEPGSLLLLATGLMGLAGLMWRRFAAA
jgi:PEP-CTERM motif